MLCGLTIRFAISISNIRNSYQLIILEENNDSTAVIASWRATAFKTLYFANKLNIKVPEQLAVMSLDGSEFADYTFPALSTSDLPLYEIGIKSSEMLMNILNNDAAPEHIMLSCRLNLRESI